MRWEDRNGTRLSPGLEAPEIVICPLVWKPVIQDFQGEKGQRPWFHEHDYVWFMNVPAV